MQYSGVWILAEQQDGRILPVSYELLTRGIELARQRGCELTAVVFGCDINDDGLAELIDRGADCVIAMQSDKLKHFFVEPYAACMAELINKFGPEIIIAAATTTGRTLMPYVAIKVETGLTADCTGLEIEQGSGNLLQTRPAIGGNIMATIKTPQHRPQMATVRPGSTKAAPKQSSRTGKIIRLEPASKCLSRVTREGFIANPDSHSLSDADTVVVVGRGIKKAENIRLVQELADTLGAALGATRDVVDRGWLSYPHQIGLSGQTISPKLYIGIGVSGAIQHLAGMQTSKTIVAVNSDPQAQIFKVADFAIVGDLFDVVPVLTEKIKQGAAFGK